MSSQNEQYDHEHGQSQSSGKARNKNQIKTLRISADEEDRSPTSRSKLENDRMNEGYVEGDRSTILEQNLTGANFHKPISAQAASHVTNIIKDQLSDTNSSATYTNKLGNLRISLDSSRAYFDDSSSKTKLPHSAATISFSDDKRAYGNNDNRDLHMSALKNLDQKPPAYTASSAASIGSQNFWPERDGYHSSGAMSDGNVSRRSVFSGESDTGDNRGRTNSSVGGGSIESNRFAHHASYYQANEAYTSDIATICSNSMVDEMDIASMISGEVATQSSWTPNAQGRTGTKKGSALSAFASERNSDGMPSGARHVSMQEQPLILNDMGPPVSRIIIQQRNGSRAGSIGGHSSASGGIASDGAHLDTDDGGSMIAEIDGHSVHSNIPRDVGLENDQAGSTTLCGHDGKANDTHNLSPLVDLATQGGSGRISPGGTVYKGRGVRRYQGRYMKLPLRRFQQNCNNVEEEESTDLIHGHCQDNDALSTGQRQSRWERSRSRSRDSRNDRGRHLRSRSYSQSRCYNRSRNFTRSDDSRKSHSRSRSRRVKDR